MQSTRQRILEILKARNLATVEELGEVLGLTSVTIRHHLDILRGEGLVAAPQVLRRSGPGRPQHTYGLTPAAGDLFPKNYHGLSTLMLDEIRERVSPLEMDLILNGVAGRLAARASARPASTPQELLDETVSFLNDQGYVAQWEETPEGQFLLHTCNCPYERVTRVHSEICSMDANFVQRLVNTPIERVSHLGSGDERCTYVVQFVDKLHAG